MSIDTSSLERSETATDQIEVSVVMPCLNEADTLAACVRTAQEALRSAGIAGEVIVADNGSSDDSPAIGRSLGARVVVIPERGYGNALMGGIAAARGRFVVTGDADESCDFRETPRFVQKLRDGYDLVVGCRLPAGGGTLMPGAMPFLHRWVGNPLFTRLARIMFDSPIHDINCGMRGFSKELSQRLEQRCDGMEFATEMVIKSRMMKASITEVPITLHPDGRKSHRPHLRTFRDGWRTLRFYMIFSPRWVFFIPGVILIVLGLLGYAVAMPRVTILGRSLDVHTLLFANAAIMMGYQAIVFAILAKVYAIRDGILPADGRIEQLQRLATLERILVVSAGAFLIGLGLLGTAVYLWWRVGFGPHNYVDTMRWVIPGVLFAVLGFQSVLAGFFLSLFGLRRRLPKDEKR